jgi:hypothetical protein
MALLMPTSANYFYNYLENYCVDKEALIYFGLYADIRSYVRMFEDGEGEGLLRKHADQIFKDYIMFDREWNIYIPEDILNELRHAF